jgi:GT2 family glycosyltransferase
VLCADGDIDVSIVDNGSSDNSFLVAQRKFQHETSFRFRSNNENVGFAAAVNGVIGEVAGDYILVLNPDCMMSKDGVHEFVRVMEANPTAGISGPLVLNGDGTIQKSCRRDIPTPWKALMQISGLYKVFPGSGQFRGFESPPDDLVPDSPIEVEGISGACMFIRKTALSSVGYMDERYFLHCEDLDWFIRFKEHGWNILFIPQIRVIHEQGACSRSQPVKVNWYKHRSMLMFYRKFFRSNNGGLVLLTVTVGVWARFLISSLKLSVIGGAHQILRLIRARK